MRKESQPWTAAAPGLVAARLAERKAAATAARAGAGGVAVHVVARAVAVRGALGHPPAAHDRVRRAVVGAADRAAELREARAAGAAAAAAGVPAFADLPVRRARAQREVEPGADGHRAPDEGGAVDEASARQAALEGPGRAADSAVVTLRDDRRRRRVTRRRPLQGAERGQCEKASQRPTALTASSGNPPQGWRPAARPACPTGARGDDGGGDRQSEVEQQVHRRRRRVRAAEAATRGERPPRRRATPRRRRSGVGGGDEGRRDGAGQDQGGEPQGGLRQRAGANSTRARRGARGEAAAAGEGAGGVVGRAPWPRRRARAGRGDR